MSNTGHIVPQQKMPKLIVVAAFNRDDEGDLKPAFDPRQMQSEDAARRLAKMIESEHAGVIAWSREANPFIGEYGEPTILFRAGDVPDME
ncbi:hypothetical protein IG197_34650 (plasmid) [Aminobacter sp. SR38]|jgi:hypothetical protein|uniref:hypothetical protein n=1 Tax=Aminobacter sp. SR38 TaxID=2774562 RepID=UPI0017813A56|nr:hypothetical protein [Aminobacter sp. SR38]QOF75512.1 hypothetical protein IG197_34650 [Aminobacter sp. SR38]